MRRSWPAIGGAIAAAIVVLLLLSCAPPVDRGRIEQLEHRDAYTSTAMIPQYTTICTPVGKVTSCRSQLTHFLPLTTHHPEAWRIEVDPPGDAGPQWLDVPQAEWELLEQGDWWERSP